MTDDWPRYLAGQGRFKIIRSPDVRAVEVSALWGRLDAPVVEVGDG